MTLANVAQLEVSLSTVRRVLRRLAGATLRPRAATGSIRRWVRLAREHSRTSSSRASRTSASVRTAGSRSPTWSRADGCSASSVTSAPASKDASRSSSGASAWRAACGPDSSPSAPTSGHPSSRRACSPSHDTSCKPQAEGDESSDRGVRGHVRPQCARIVPAEVPRLRPWRTQDEVVRFTITSTAQVGGAGAVFGTGTSERLASRKSLVD